MILAALLLFSICTANSADGDECEAGEVRARSCVAAEAWVRAGLRPGQRLVIIHCQDATP